MDSAVQRAKKLVDRLRGLQERQDAARESWGNLIAELERQAMAAGEVVQKALKQPESGAPAEIWAEPQPHEREGLTLTVFFGERQAKQETHTQPPAMARFYVDLFTCQVVADRKALGIAENDRRGRSGFKKFADLGDVQDMTLSAFVKELLGFLEWASVGDGRGSRTFRFSERDWS